LLLRSSAALTHAYRYYMDYLYHTKITMPKMPDLVHSLPYIVSFLLLRYVLSNYVFRRLGDKLIAPARPAGKLDPEVRQLRLERFGTCIFKFLYFCAITRFGYRLLRDEDILPDCLRFFESRAAGPMSVTEAAFVNYPNHDMSAAMQFYYFVQLGYHVHSLLWTLVQPRRNDFAEMMLHHISTAILIITSYTLNYIRGGAQIMLVHDIADIFGYAVKASVDTPYTLCTLTLYLGLLISWGWTRLWIFPRYIISSVMNDAGSYAPEPIRYVPHVSAILLVVLAVLHYYWYALFIRMGVLFLRTGETVDIQHRVEKPQDIKPVARSKVTTCEPRDRQDCALLPALDQTRKVEKPAKSSRQT